MSNANIGAIATSKMLVFIPGQLTAKISLLCSLSPSWRPPANIKELTEVVMHPLALDLEIREFYQ